MYCTSKPVVPSGTKKNKTKNNNNNNNKKTAKQQQQQQIEISALSGHLTYHASSNSDICVISDLWLVSSELTSNLSRLIKFRSAWFRTYDITVTDCDKSESQNRSSDIENARSSMASSRETQRHPQPNSTLRELSNDLSHMPPLRRAHTDTHTLTTLC